MMSLALNIQLKKMGYRELFYVGKILHEPLTDWWHPAKKSKTTHSRSVR